MLVILTSNGSFVKSVNISYSPYGLTASTSAIYTVTWGNSLFKYDLNLTQIKMIYGCNFVGSNNVSCLVNTRGADFDKTNNVLYVAEFYQSLIHVFDSDLARLRIISVSPFSVCSVHYHNGIVYAGSSGNVILIINSTSYSMVNIIAPCPVSWWIDSFETYNNNFLFYNCAKSSRINIHFLSNHTFFQYITTFSAAFAVHTDDEIRILVGSSANFLGISFYSP